MLKSVFTQVGNPNLLDNSDFTNPVNQRGRTSYTAEAVAAYAVDRWAILYGTFDVSARQLTGTAYTGRTCCIRQALSESEKGLAVGSTIAFSAQINGQIHKSGMTVQDRSQYGEFSEVPAGYICEDFEVVCYSISGTVYLAVYAKKALVIDWVKAEKGGIATPYVPKGYGAELAECLRYFQRVHADWRIYPTLKDMLYRFSQSTLQVMRIKPTISAHGTPYTFGCTINALDAQPMAFTVETKITEQGQNSAAASMLGYFDLSADL